MHIAEGRRARDQLLINARFVAIRQRVWNADDHHAIQQRLVFLLLQKLVEFREVGMRENGLIQVDERKARYFDVLLLRHGQQQVEKLALHQQKNEQNKNTTARG